MGLQTLTALALSLMLCACGAGTGNGADNVGATEGNEMAAPSDGSGDSRDGQESANGTSAPEPSGDVTLAAAPAQTTGGSTMTLTLRNGSSQQIGYNLCTSALETSAGRSIPTSRVCTMELRTLEPGRNADYRYELPVNMAEGSYRFVTQVEWMQSSRGSGVRSNSFAVRSD